MKNNRLVGVAVILILVVCMAVAALMPGKRLKDALVLEKSADGRVVTVVYDAGGPEWQSNSAVARVRVSDERFNGLKVGDKIDATKYWYGTTAP